jgi:hypothetical protein
MNQLFQTLIQVFAMCGLDKATIQEVMPEATDEVLDSVDYDLGQKMGKLTSMAVAGGLRRHFDNLMVQGFTREEAVQIVAGIAGNASSK